MAPEWPAWELRGHGSAAPAPMTPPATETATTDGGRSAGVPSPRLDPLAPWVSARLTFPDGARIDVLVAVADDGITVEDLRADPPLPLDGFATLAHWIEGPLDDACRIATGRPLRRPAPQPSSGPTDHARTEQRQAQPGAPAGETVRLTGEATALGGASRASQPESVRAPEGERERAGEPVLGGDETPGVAAGTGGTAEAVRVAPPDAGTPSGEGAPSSDGAPSGADAGPSALRDTAPESSPPPDGPSRTEEPPPPPPEASCRCADSSDGADAPSAPADDGAAAVPPGSDAAAADTAERTRGVHRIRPVRLRAGERRRIAADAYREAQREGRDPVLAVMDVTGRSRRRALRLIAGARDDGLLTRRNNKRQE